MELAEHRLDQLDRVFGQIGDPFGLLRIGWVIGQQVSIVLDHDATARGVHDNRLHLILGNEWPPGIDVAPGVLQSTFAIG